MLHHHELAYPFIVVIPVNINSSPGTNLIDLIEVQKSRAIRQWKEAFSKQFFTSRSIYDEVLQQLNEGKVPPIYHTLCRDPEKRLFLPNTVVSDGNSQSGSIEFSTMFVEAGCSTRNVNESTNEAIWYNDNFSYQDAFFATDGLGLLVVSDISLKENWMFDMTMTNVITNLVNTSADMVGYDVEVTEMSSVFPFDKKKGRFLLTRSLSRGVVADCFENSEADSIYAIVGSPGIGKSWTLIYALQQALLFENVCVMFCFQKDERALVCIRKEHRIYAWTMESAKFTERCSSGIFKNGNVLVLLDPREAVEGGASYSPGNRRLIYAASNNLKHFSTAVAKDTPFAKRYLDPFTKNELEVSIPYVTFGKDCCIKTVLKRAKVVGCLLRYVIGDKVFRERKKEQDDYIDSIRNENLGLQAVFNWSGMMKEKDTVPGSIFVVSVKKSNSYGKTALYADSDEEDVVYLDDDDIDDGEMENDKSIMDDGFVSGQEEENRSMDDDDVIEDFGYDGEHIKDYGEMDVSIISSSIYLRLTKNSRATLLTYLGKVSPGDFSEMGYVVEELFWSDLRTKNMLMKCWKFGDQVHDLTDIIFQPKSVLAEATFSTLLDKVFGFDKQTVCRLVDSHKLIEFAASPFDVIQVTVSPPENRKLMVSNLKSLFLAIGFLEYDENGCIAITRHQIREKLKFYWAVPFTLKKFWINKDMKKKRGIKISQNKKQKDFECYDVVNECYQKYVDSHVILIEKRRRFKRGKKSGERLL